MSDIVEKLREVLGSSVDSTPEKVSIYFKTGAGDYAEHDRFIGITVPVLRKIAKIYKDIELQVIEELLKSKYNEERLLALLILVQQYQKASMDRQKELCRFYLSNLNRINNWNLVDSSAHHILGHYLWDKDRSLLARLAESDILWERRIAIVASWYFIRKSDLEWTFKIVGLLLNDSHDLIHKACGWMLREAGKQDQVKLATFLDQQLQAIPRAMLRYAIEKFPEDMRKSYLIKNNI
ncbi:MAG: DNA alkylation repair protein [Rickettsiaceae bacterium]|nr:DNA alkylation repair protein [Rickettsiaceae bacterium]